jgi:hypothetical protein
MFTRDNVSKRRPGVRQLSRKAVRILSISQLFEPSLHLDLVWEADSWTKWCHIKGIDAFDYDSERGDLYFLLKSLRPYIECTVFIDVHRLWIE